MASSDSVQDAAGQAQSNIRSQIVSGSGNATLDAKQDLTDRIARARSEETRQGLGDALRVPRGGRAELCGVGGEERVLLLRVQGFSLRDMLAHIHKSIMRRCLLF